MASAACAPMGSAVRTAAQPTRTWRCRASPRRSATGSSTPSLPTRSRLSTAAYDLPDRWHPLRLVPLGDGSFRRVVAPAPGRRLGHVVGLRVTGPTMLITRALDRRL